jgi:adenylate cyclase
MTTELAISEARTPESQEIHEEVTLVFTDVVGSTRMTVALGDLRAHHVMECHNRIVREELRSWGGRELELQGDGFVLAFATPSAAVGCAIGIQRAMALYRTSHPEDLRVRIGVHTGEALRVEDHYFGSAVILCARIANAAGADEILVSDTTAEHARVNARRLREPRFEELKGFDGPQRVHPVGWSALDASFDASRPAPRRRAPAMAAAATA